MDEEHKIYKFANISTFLQTSRSLQKHVYTVHAPHEKDAMMSRCLDWKEVHTIRPVLPVYNTGQLFLSFGGTGFVEWYSNCPLGRMY